MPYPILPANCRSVCFASFTPAPQSDSDPLSLPRRLLWGNDPYLLSGLLRAICDESHNRNIATLSDYDPLLPEQITSLRVEGMGLFTLSPGVLSQDADLIDCRLPTVGDLTEANQLRQRLQATAAEIGRISDAYGMSADLLLSSAQRLADCRSLEERAEHLARRFSHSEKKAPPLAVLTLGKNEEPLWKLPCPATTRLICFTPLYGIESLLLSKFASALEARGCGFILLTHALTHRPVGLWLPDYDRCYLIEYCPSFPTQFYSCKQVSLRRYLLPYCTEERRAWRNLAAATKGLEQHLVRTLTAYRTMAKEEERLRLSLYSESRLQNLRKRLLIDLFCS